MMKHQLRVKKKPMKQMNLKRSPGSRKNKSVGAVMAADTHLAGAARKESPVPASNPAGLKAVIDYQEVAQKTRIL
jgi:hypothetical protein